MGVGRSKSMSISYEEACKRVPGPVLTRLQETFKRLSSVSGTLPQLTFMRDVLGDAVPIKLAEAIYESFGGGQKGISLKDLVCGLVLLSYGSQHEKARFIGQLVCGESDKVTRERLDQLVIDCDGAPPTVSLDDLFPGDTTTSSLDIFESWLCTHKSLASFSAWLLGEGGGLILEGPPDPPTFHQTLAGRYGVDQQVIMDLEKCYWSLKGGSGKFDLSTLTSYVNPPLPDDLCEDLFRVMDLNLDGHIDLTELIEVVALVCRGSGDDPHKFCFRLFDRDEDNLLSRDELVTAVSILHTIRDINTSPDDTTLLEEVTSEEVADSALQAHSKEKEGHLTADEYFNWTNECDLGSHLVKILVEICHIKFGLRPSNPELEGSVVNGYLNRFRKSGRCHGDTVYIIPSEWFTQWRVYTSQEVESPTKHHKKNKRSKSKSRSKSTQLTTPLPATPPRSHSMPGEAIELGSIVPASVTAEAPPPPPPIDNAPLCVPEVTGSKKLPSLTNEGGRLVKSRLLVEGKDYVVLPEVVWKVFISWHGTTGYSIPSLPRIVGPSGQVDLYPLVFKLYRHTTNPAPAKSSNLPWPLASLLTSVGLLSSTPTVSAPLLTAGGDESGAAPQPRRVPYYQAAFPKSTTLAQVSEAIQAVLRVKSEDLRLYNYSSEDPVLLEEDGVTLEQLGLTEGDKLLVETRNKDNSWPEEIIAILKEVIVKDKPKQPVVEVKVPQGATGLSNLGNTCFMNSALQCVSNTRPLTTYFRERDHLSEVNKDNPLGTGGVLAKRYGELIDDLWTGNSKSITPLKFRFTVGRYAPQFNGFQQQDCQELLAFLLDGLHEDLNRVKDKAYRELGDSDGRDDSVVAKEAWDYHLSRNQSIIVDLFQGQLKSVVTCKECQFSSVRFDPFTFLSLPLPMESTVNLEVIVVLLDGSQPLRYGLKLELDDKYRQLKRAVCDLSGLEPADILLVEVYGGIVRSIPSDSTKIRSMLGGWLYAYEIPPAPTLTPTARADSPDEARRVAKVTEVRRERAMSLHTIEEERKRARLAQANLSSSVSHDTTDDVEIQAVDATPPDDAPPSNTATDTPPSNTATDAHPSNTATDTPPNDASVESPDMESVSPDLVARRPQSPEPPRSGLEGSDGFVFAFHRRTFSVENYFVASQKTRPAIFGTPVVVPCDGSSQRAALYECVWGQVKRLMIPDPPNRTRSPEHGSQYPFVLKLVSKDGLTCSQCPWYEFCIGCPLPCDESPLGRTSGYIAVDWDNTTLHLKYQSAQERPLEHASMESLKVIDTKPIDLYDCFKAFVRQDELGDEESWYCKRCQTHREAIKSLEIWRLPPVLIIHLKRFQFFNGRWVKSQRDVTFPLNLDPTRHTAHNSNGHDHEDEEASDEPMELQTESHDIAMETDTPHDVAMDTDTPQDVSCDIQPSDDSQLYKLFALCVHSGMMGGGHYVSFAKNPNTSWYYFNDSSCKETSEDRVLEESPYLLFYELQDLDYNKFRGQRSGAKGQDVGADDDREFEETLKNLRKSCSIQ